MAIHDVMIVGGYAGMTATRLWCRTPVSAATDSPNMLTAYWARTVTRWILGIMALEVGATLR